MVIPRGMLKAAFAFIFSERKRLGHHPRKMRLTKRERDKIIIQMLFLFRIYSVPPFHLLDLSALVALATRDKESRLGVLSTIGNRRG